MATMKQIMTWLGFIGVTVVSYLLLKKSKKIHTLQERLARARTDLAVEKASQKVVHARKQYHQSIVKYFKTRGIEIDGVVDDINLSVLPDPSSVHPTASFH